MYGLKNNLLTGGIHIYMSVKLPSSHTNLLIYVGGTTDKQDCTETQRTYIFMPV